MTFFVTSVGPGKGADLGGLAGADRHCQALAEAAGAGDRTWRAYLSTQAAGGEPAVNARDRIGAGPWQNAKGVVIAQRRRRAARRQQPHQGDRAHREGRGRQRPRRQPEPARHPDRLAAGRHGVRRRRRTGPAATGRRAAPRAPPWSATTTARACATTRRRRSWNSSHPSRGGCSQEALRGTGGDGLFYCFAAN